MKTIFLTLGLLLLTASSSYAVPLALEPGPARCCFSFSKVIIPPNKIQSIKKTHKSCNISSFVLKTVKGKEICYRFSDPWIQKTLKNVTKPSLVTKSSYVEGSSHA